MVRAILAGNKTQTRRTLRVQPSHYLPEWPPHYDEATGGAMWGSLRGDHGIACPYGKPGDRLWVRETWQRGADFEVSESPHGIDLARIYYRADQVGAYAISGRPWRPSIFMPRAASRITLEVTDVRVERLQTISNADCIAEGIENYTYPPTTYRALWNSINGKDSWDANPWVWVIQFKKL